LKLIAAGKVYSYKGGRDAKQMEEFALNGWKTAEGSPMPRELALYNKFLMRLDDFMVRFGLPIMFVLGLCYCIWMTCLAPGPTEEEKAKRNKWKRKLKEFEEINAEMEIAKRAGDQEKIKECKQKLRELREEGPTGEKKKTEEEAAKEKEEKPKADEGEAKAEAEAEEEAPKAEDPKTEDAKKDD
jgi:hypothetical protein